MVGMGEIAAEHTRTWLRCTGLLVERAAGPLAFGLMNTFQRFSAGFLGLAIMLQPLSVSAAELTFGKPVAVSAESSPGDILKQSDQYKDGVLTVDGHEFVLDEYGHAVLRQEEKGWLCSWFGWWCPSREVGEITFDKQSAEQRVVAQAVSAIHAEMVKDTGRVLPLLAFAYPEPLPAGTVVYQSHKNSRPMNVLNDSWFFFLDLEPGAFFDHRAEFVLVDVKTGEITRDRVFAAPRIDGIIRYMDVGERWTTPDRFYPADLKDLPPGGDWPMTFNDTGSSSGAPALPPAGLRAPAAPDAAAKTTSLYDVPWLIPVAEAEAVPGAAPVVDPCVGKPRKKVAVTIAGEGPNTIHNDGLVDGETIGNSEQNMVNLLGEMGVAQNDIHRLNPENTAKLDDVFKEIERVTKDLGPCDKFFFYIFGHGTITDDDGDHIPDKPSWGIVYGHGENEEVMGKDRWTEHSLIKLLEGIKAQDINLVIESCFSGSIRNWIAADTANPAEGSNWHIFLAAGALKPSYGHGTYGGNAAGAYYTDAYTACASRKLAARGYVNPTIEQIEEVMRECQKEFNENPTENIRAPQVEDVTRVTYTISPSVRIKEGDSGVTYAEFTVTRSPVSDDSVSFDFKTYDNDPDGDVANYPGPKDYQWNKKGSDVTFEPGQASVTIRIGINGDTDVEDDETFGVWFPTLHEARTVTILDDDKPVAASSSSTATAVKEESKTTISLAPITFDLSGLNGIGYKVLDGKDGYSLGEKITITIDGHGDADGSKPVIETKCPTCDDLADQARTQADVCSFLEQELADTKAESADLDRQIVSAVKDLKDAQNALNAFTNPKSYAESGGKRVTSSDLRAERDWSAGLWAQYRSGDMTAEQLSDAWSNGMSDADRQRFKDEIQKKLQQDVADTLARLERLRADRDDVTASLEGLAADVDECNAEFDRLLDAWMSCEDACPVAEAETGLALTGGDGFASASAVSASASSSSSSNAAAAVASSNSSSSSSAHRDTQPSSSSSSKPSSVPPVVRQSSSSKSSSTAAAVTPVPSSKSSSSSSARAVSQCPAGTTSDKAECEQVCGHEGGTCAVSNGCYSCEVAQCPAGTYTNTCPSSCISGCDVVGQDGSTQCLQCKKSCTEVCAGYGQVGTNWNTYIQTQLNQYTCVSAATVATESTTIGSCSCSNQPEVQVDATVPVCKGTPCGDVTCGGSSTCQQGESTVTIHCNWGGWKNVGENKFQPVFGQ